MQSTNLGLISIFSPAIPEPSSLEQVPAPGASL